MAVCQLAGIDPHDFMPLLAVVDEDIFERSQVTDSDHLSMDFFYQFTSDGFSSCLTELDCPPQRTVESIMLNLIVTLCNQQTARMLDEANRKCSYFSRFQFKNRKSKFLHLRLH